MMTWPDGKYHDRLIRAGGAIADGGWRSNIVVDRCRRLLAAFMKGDSAALGVQSLAVGRGDAAWDSAPVAPTSWPLVRRSMNASNKNSFSLD